MESNVRDYAALKWPEKNKQLEVEGARAPVPTSMPTFINALARGESFRISDFYTISSKNFAQVL